MKSQKILLVGGRRRQQNLMRESTQYYDRARVYELDLESERLSCVIEHVTVDDFCASKEPVITFKAASTHQGAIYLVTETESLTYSLDNYEKLNCLSHSIFNDCHHVVIDAEGFMWVVVSGLDMVVKIDLKGQVVGKYPVISAENWRGIDCDVDYRKINSLKPHSAHPNHLFFINNELFVTRFHQRDAVSLFNPERKIDIGIQSPHDGIVYEDRVFFTTVDGHVVVACSSTLNVIEIYNLNNSSTNERPLGWCRGIHVIDSLNVLVGFSRLRPTKIKQNVKWVANKLSSKNFHEAMPTRVVHYNLKDKKIKREYDVEEAGLGVIFSILPLKSH